MTTKTADLRVEDHGSIILVQPLTPEARAWIKEHVDSEPWQWVGRALAVEWRYAGDLVAGAAMAGLSVE